MTNVSPRIIRTLTFPQFSSLYNTMRCPFSNRDVVQTSQVHPNPVLWYSLRGRVLFFVLHFVHVMHLISWHHVHCICIRVRLLHPSIFPVVRFAIRHSHLLRRPPFVSFHERVLNVLGMDQVLSSGLGIPPVDHLSSFVPFGGRLVLQRLTG